MSRRIPAVLGAAAAALGLSLAALGLSLAAAGPVAACPDPGEPGSACGTPVSPPPGAAALDPDLVNGEPDAPSAPDADLGTPQDAPLARIGDDLVRGDDLTGAGRPAASWVPVSEW